MLNGKISQVIGPVVDVAFENGVVLPLYRDWETDRKSVV